MPPTHKQVRYVAQTDMSLKEDHTKVWYKGDTIDETLLPPDRLRMHLDAGRIKAVPVGDAPVSMNTEPASAGTETPEKGKPK